MPSDVSCSTQNALQKPCTLQPLTHTPPAKVIEAVLQEADLCRAAIADVTRERLEFESSWGAWLGAQLSAGMAQPLPRGWVPQPDPVNGGMHFLNTKTGRRAVVGGQLACCKHWHSYARLIMIN